MNEDGISNTISIDYITMQPELIIDQTVTDDVNSGNKDTLPTDAV